MKTNTMGYKVRQYLLFAGVTTAVFLMVVIVPFIYGLYLTMTSWDGVSMNKPFVGLANYVSALADTGYWVSLGRTFIYSAIAVILVNAVAFILAYLVTSGIKGQNFFRAGFFIPNLIGGIVLGYVWKFVFNKALVSLGEAITQGNVKSLLATETGAIIALIIVSVWQYAGYMMLIYVAGFMSVPDEVIEAAKIDGCTGTQSIIHISIPLMTSSFVQCIFLSITRCFMVYDVNLSLTNGDPYGSSALAAMHVYNEAFINKDYGTGQAEALILFIICAVIGGIQVYVGKKGEVQA
ncbi:MAG: sugar ABC transporter permease [Lachnospiraceae bacterium]|nr:sugar ABC transporter permease [Lachnospiraceae bacterium]